MPRKSATVSNVEAFPAVNRFEALDPARLSPEEQTAVVELALSVLAERNRRDVALRSPSEVCAFLRLKIGERKNEVFGAVFLDNQNRVLRYEEVFSGTINATSVYPRVFVQKTLEFNAAAVILFHNHPSGMAEPSFADQALTKKLSEALALVDVRVLDHIVVASGETFSFAERGLI